MIKAKPEIVELFFKEGIEFWQRGRHFWGLCPFHSERTPSFCVDVGRQRWRCFGACNEGGDVISFIQKRHRLSFKEALQYLGINGGAVKQIRSNSLELKKRKLLQKFKRWIQLYRRAICELLRIANRIDLKVVSSEQLALPGIGEMYFMKFIYEYHLDILNGNDNWLKLALYRSLLEWKQKNLRLMNHF